MKHDYRVSVGKKNSRGRYVVDVDWWEGRSRPSFKTREEATNNANVFRDRLSRGEAPFLSEQERALTWLAASEQYQTEHVQAGEVKPSARERLEQHNRDLSRSPLAGEPVEATTTFQLFHFRTWRREASAARQKELKRKPKPLSDTTTKKDFVYMASVAAHALRMKRIKSNPFDHVPESERAKLFPSEERSHGTPIPDDSFEKIVAELPPRYVAAARLLRETGMRKGHMASLDWSRNFPEPGWLWLPPGTKKGRERWIPLDETVAPILPNPPASGEGRVFSETIYSGLTREWNRARAKLGLSYRIHDLRHTFATETARAAGRDEMGIALAVVPATASRYGDHMVKERAAAVAAKRREARHTGGTVAAFQKTQETA